MGKKMKSTDVIYGASHSKPLKGWNDWVAVEELIRGNIGSKAKIDLPEGKQAIKKANGDDRMAKAYVKIGLIGNDLVLRAKANKFLGDVEYDAVLVRGYKALAAKYKGSAESIEDQGRVVVIDELRTAKTRNAVWSALQTLGASRTECAQLDSYEKAEKLFKKINVDKEILTSLNSRRLLLSDKGHALIDLSSSGNRRELFQRLETCGATKGELTKLDTRDALKKLCTKLGISSDTTKWIVAQAWALTDRGVALELLEKGPQMKDVWKLLRKTGMSPGNIRALFQNGASIDAVAKKLVTAGISKSSANSLAEGIVDAVPQEQQLIDQLPSVKEARLVRKILNEIDMNAWLDQIDNGADLDQAATQLAKALGITSGEATRVTNLVAP